MLRAGLGYDCFVYSILLQRQLAPIDQNGTHKIGNGRSQKKVRWFRIPSYCLQCFPRSMRCRPRFRDTSMDDCRRVPQRRRAEGLHHLPIEGSSTIAHLRPLGSLHDTLPHEHTAKHLAGELKLCSPEYARDVAREDVYSFVLFGHRLLQGRELLLQLVDSLQTYMHMEVPPEVHISMMDISYTSLSNPRNAVCICVGEST